jgi:hypothetical protein
VAPFPEPVGIPRRDRSPQRIHFPRRLIVPDAGRETADHPEVMSERPALRQVVLQRRPEPGRRGKHVVEPCRQDAEHGVGPLIEGDLAAYHGGVGGKTAAPQRIAQDHDRGAVEPVVAGLEGSAQRRRHPQHPEIPGADPLSLQPFRFRSAHQSRLPGPEDGNRLERTASLGDFPVGDERLGDMVAFPDRRQLPGPGIRERLEENRVDDAEDRRGAADPEGQGEHRHRGEARSTAEPPRRIAEIGHQGFHQVFPAVAADLLPYPCRPVELEPGGPARRPGIQPSGSLSGGGLLQVVLDLVVEVPFGLPAPDEGPEAAGQLAPERHA